MKEFLTDFFDYLKQHKKLWLAPIVIVLLFVGALMLLAQNPATAPFIYTIF